MVENRQFLPTPLLFGALVGVTPFEFHRDFWNQKTMSPWAAALFMWSYI